MKPGYKTTEFWLSLLAMLLGALAGSGVLPVESKWAQLVGWAITGLGALGYSASRGKVKAAESLAKLPEPEAPAKSSP